MACGRCVMDQVEHLLTMGFRDIISRLGITEEAGVVR